MPYWPLRLPTEVLEDPFFQVPESVKGAGRKKKAEGKRYCYYYYEVRHTRMEEQDQPDPLLRLSPLHVYLVVTPLLK